MEKGKRKQHEGKENRVQKKKRIYRNLATRPLKKEINEGYKGILVTYTVGNEGLVFREIFNILNEYIEDEPNASKKPESDDDDDNNSSTKSISMEETIKKEIASLKNTNEQKRFEIIDTNVRGVSFVKFLDKNLNPLTIVQNIMNDVLHTQVAKTRFCQKFIPTEFTCRASTADICKFIKPLIELHFNEIKERPKKFSIVYKARHNDTMNRNEIIVAVANIVEELFNKEQKQFEVDLNNPDICIMIEMARKVAYLSVVNDYYKLRKLNLHEIAEEGTKTPVSKKDKSATKTESTNSDKDDQ